MTRDQWDALCASAPVLLDGAWGTQLQEYGLPPGEGADEWNCSHPEAVGAVARSYVEAGSRIILTNTFGANPIMLARHGAADRTEAINEAGAACSRQAVAGTATFVFGSIGPTGQLLMMGDVSEADMLKGFERQVAALQAGGVDGFVVETMAALDEATLAVQAATATGLPVVASMVYDTGPDKDRTMMGVTPAQAATVLAAAGAWAIGANCGQGPDTFLAIGQQYREATNLPIWLKPNAGLPEMRNGQAVYDLAPKDFAAALDALHKAGAMFLGGCCGTSPTFIKAIAQRWHS